MRSPGLVDKNLGNHEGDGRENTPRQREKTGVAQDRDELATRGPREDREAHADRPRGRAYAQAVPAERLLLETDAPSQAGERYDAPAEAARLAVMLEALADLRRTPRDDLAARIARTGRELLR